MNTHALQKELATYNHLKDALLNEYPEIDNETLDDTLEGETNLLGLVSWVLDKARDDADLVAGIDQRISDLQERKDRLKHRIDKAKSAVTNAMEKAGIKKHEYPEQTVSVKKTPDKVLVVDAALIPDVYFNVKQVRTLNTVALKKALQDGDIEGAVLSNGGTTLSIRTK